MKVSVIGLGKLGSPLAAVLASKGHEVIGVDVNPQFVEKINCSIAPVEEPGLQELMSAHRSSLKATLNYDEALFNSDVTFVIVPTPTGQNGLFSNDYLLQALEHVGHSLRKKTTYHLVVITSTVTPGSSGGEIQQTLEKFSLRRVGEDLGLCYNPEFIALGSVIKNMLFPDMILIGESDKKAGDLLEKLHHTVCGDKPLVRRMNLVNAEVTKIAVNTFVTTKISYANMLSDICERLPGGDVDIVTEAVGLDSRIGSKYLKAAVAFGGPCFPRDNIALGALAQQLGARADIALATQAVNHYQYERLFSLVTQQAPSLKVSILGLSYKPGTNVVEESQGIKMANYLVQQGYEVTVFDPQALIPAQKALHPSVQAATSLQQCVQSSDTVLIMTSWPEFSQQLTPELFASHQVIIDCWRILQRQAFKDVCKLIYLGCHEMKHHELEICL